MWNRSVQAGCAGCLFLIIRETVLLKLEIVFLFAMWIQFHVLEGWID